MGAPLTLVPGMVFAGDYRVERPLSAGGMGAVFVATQLSTGRERALKIMLGELVGNADLKRRFEQEAKIGAQIDSEHVVEVVGAGVDADSGVPWLAMELLQGEDLASFMQRRGALAPAVVADLFEQLTHALGAAHDKQIIHRDLKPENLFLANARRAGVSFILKVLDFGIAKLVNQARTSATGAMGTPLWMAPEQAQAGAAVTPAADVWAMGLIAFAALTGKTFWLSAHAPNSSAIMVLREIVMEPIPPASARARELGAPTLPPGFDAWFARCVDRDPRTRFPHASAMQVALRQMLSGGSASATVAGSPVLDAMRSIGVVAPPAVSRLHASSSGPVAAQTAGTHKPVGVPIAPVSKGAPPRRTPVGLYAGLAVGACALTGALVFAFGGDTKKPRHTSDSDADDSPPARANKGSGSGAPSAATVPTSEPSTPSAPTTPTPSAAPPALKSCEDAKADLIAEGRVADTTDDPDLTSTLNRGAFLDACEVPSSVAVSLCVVYAGAGPLKGVTVKLVPHDEELTKCVDAKVRLIESKATSYGVATTTFAPQPAGAAKPQPPPPSKQPCACPPGDLNCAMRCSAKSPPPAKPQPKCNCRPDDPLCDCL